MPSIKDFIETQQQRRHYAEKSLYRSAQSVGISVEELPEDFQKEPLYRLGEEMAGWKYQQEITQERERYQRQLETLRSMIDMLLENIAK